MITLICIILILLLIILLSPMCLTVVYDDDLDVHLSCLLWHKPLYPVEKPVRLSDYTPEKLKKRRKRMKKKQCLQKRRSASKKSTAHDDDNTSITEQLRAVRLVIHILKRVYRGVLSSARVRIDRFYVSVASEDAAKTAILYGVVSQSAAYILGLLDNFTKMRVKRDAIRIYPDFLATESDFSLRIRFSMPFYKVLYYWLKSSWMESLQENADKQNKKENNTDKADTTINGGNQHE